ncbi:hypothetical protein [Falsihalocynthiibacter sp. CO-5D18]|uniref:hypothetical protein n=1 Tax=Falsihalocynthiibacter sp. CO-5D18 TaxID=3240872 RepID=UPI003510499F
MKHTLTALLLGLLTASAAAAESVNRSDLFASCVVYQNTKWKAGLSGTLNYLTAPQIAQLEPYSFELIKQECGCTVTAAFKSLSEDTIVAYNKSLTDNGDGITLGTDAAAKEFQKAGMMDKKIACTVKSLDSSGYDQELKDLSK